MHRRSLIRICTRVCNSICARRKVQRAYSTDRERALPRSRKYPGEVELWEEVVQLRDVIVALDHSGGPAEASTRRVIKRPDRIGSGLIVRIDREACNKPTRHGGDPLALDEAAGALCRAAEAGAVPTGYFGIKGQFASPASMFAGRSWSQSFFAKALLLT